MRLTASFGPRGAAPSRPAPGAAARLPAPRGAPSAAVRPRPALGPLSSPRLRFLGVRRAQVCAGAGESPCLPCFAPGCKCRCREIDQLLARLRFREHVASAAALFLYIFKSYAEIKMNSPQKSRTPVQKSLSSGDVPYPAWMCFSKISVYFQRCNPKHLSM